MDIKRSLKAIQEQKDLCNQLMKSLDALITDAKATSDLFRIHYATPSPGVYGHRIVSNDIRRLRRELLVLDKMITKQNLGGYL